jgi:Pin2-interacting protein X1
MSNLAATERRGDADTQNKLWSDDKSKFGYRMLQKMGWSEGRGLGANENGMVEHLRARKKTSNAGIGAAAATNSAWNVPAQVASDLNDVLTRLSASVPVSTSASVPTSAQTSVKKSGLLRSRGYMGRRAAGKSIGTYSKEALREIFGGAPLQSPAPADADDKATANDRKRDQVAVRTLHDPSQDVSAALKNSLSGSRRPHGDARKECQRRKDRREHGDCQQTKEKRGRKSRAKPASSGTEEVQDRDLQGEHGDREADGASFGVAPGSGITKHRLSRQRRKRV